MAIINDELVDLPLPGLRGLCSGSPLRSALSSSRGSPHATLPMSSTLMNGTFFGGGIPNGSITDRGCTGEFFCVKAKKSFGSTYARKKEAKNTSRSTICANPKIGNFHFQRWWPIFTCDNYFAMLTSRPPGFSDLVAHGFCMCVPLRG